MLEDLNGLKQEYTGLKKSVQKFEEQFPLKSLLVESEKDRKSEFTEYSNVLDKFYDSLFSILKIDPLCINRLEIDKAAEIYFFNKSVALFGLKKYTLCLEYLDAVKKINPVNEDVSFLIGNVYRKLRKRKEAIQEFQTHIGLKGKYSDYAHLFIDSTIM